MPLVLVHGTVGEEAGDARRAIEEADERITAPAVAVAAGVRVVVQVVDSRPFAALIAAVDERDALVIVAGTWSESPLRGAGPRDRGAGGAGRRRHRAGRGRPAPAPRSVGPEVLSESPWTEPIDTPAPSKDPPTVATPRDADGRPHPGR